MSDSIPIIPELELTSFVRGCADFKQLNTCSSELLAGDGSGRSFYRISCKGAKKASAILLYTPPGIGPKLSGDSSYSQEQSFIELCKYFPGSGIPTPVFYGQDEKRNWVLMEDVGSLALFRFVSDSKLSKNDSSFERVFDRLGNDAALKLFKKAILLIAAAQQLSPNKNIIAYRRFLSFENYRTEISEFTEFYAEPLGLQKSASKELDKVFDAICETIMSFPQKLSFFDYNAHNLFVSDQGDLRVLDFQDACLVSSARDIVSLINDRGMDELLGESRHAALLKFYLETLNLDSKFQQIYDFTLLHWDLRVTGRFVKLNQKFKTDKYSQWIPSTLRRLGRTLKRTENSLHGLNSLIEISHKLSPEVKEGFSDPWPFPS